MNIIVTLCYLDKRAMHSEKQYDRGFEYGVKHLLSPKSGLLSDVLLSTLELSEESFKELLALGSIYLEGQRLLENALVPEGAYVRLHSKPRRFPKNTFDWSQRVIFENNNFVVVNKPAALPVHPSVDNIRENLQVYLSEFLKTDLLITHRLDVPTSGLLVLAKTKGFLTLFNQLLVQRSVEKIYRARVQGVSLKEGLYTHYMEQSPRAPKRVQAEEFPEGLQCRLKVFDIRDDESEQEVRIELLTGRTHQIRAQLSALGSPICGDVMYGATQKYDTEQIDLTAESLKFLDFDFRL